MTGKRLSLLGAPTGLSGSILLAGLVGGRIVSALLSLVSSLLTTYYSLVSCQLPPPPPLDTLALQSI